MVKEEAMEEEIHTIEKTTLTDVILARQIKNNESVVLQ